MSSSHEATPGSPSRTSRVIVLGDVSYDTFLVPVPEDRIDLGVSGHTLRYWPNERRWLVMHRCSGAWFLRDIIQSAIGTLPGGPKAQTYEVIDVYDKMLDKQGLFLRSLIQLRLFKKSPFDPDKVYRIDELAGWVDGTISQDSKDGHKRLFDRLHNSLPTDLLPANAPPAEGFSGNAARGTADVVVVHDRAGIFRDLPNVEGLAFPLLSGAKAIVWQMFSPLAHGSLWNSFASSPNGWQDCTVLVAKEECLRQAGVNVRQEGSLERTLNEFVGGLKDSPRLKQLARCRHLIVRFAKGALHYDRDRQCTRAYVLPNVTERYVHDRSGPGEHEKSGWMAGYTSILVAAVVKGIVWSLNHPNGTDPFRWIGHSIMLGCVLGEQHFREGYADEDLLKRVLKDPTYIPKPVEDLFDVKKLDELFNQKRFKDDFAIATVEIPKTFHDVTGWRRIYALWHGQPSPSPLEVAREIVLRGLKHVTRGGQTSSAGPVDDRPRWPCPNILVPFAEYGAIKTCDQHEINRFSAIQALAREYLAHKERKRPLSIAVFGPPGSGKNFTLKQILNTVDPRLSRDLLEFNLAQFHQIDDLRVAFHKAQDRALFGGVPLVVFDEFDSAFNGEPLGWLKYFLAPMQDGTFQHGESIYKIGRAIFAFAGGTASSFLNFSAGMADERAFSAAKGPDFVSRLRGHLNISGINARDGDRDDILIRRAVILRSLLQQHVGYIFDTETDKASIDGAVIHAFLKIEEFKHGVRSMEAIVEMATVSRSRRTFQKSSVPPAEQLAMHVNAEEFGKLLEEE